MIAIEGVSADEVWRQAGKLLQQTSIIQEGRDQPTRELLHVGLTMSDPKQRLVFSRPFNPAFAIADMIWMISGSNLGNFLQFWNPRMKQFLDDDKPYFHGAYGYRLGSKPNLNQKLDSQLRLDSAPRSSSLDQIRRACEALMHNPNSRQVVLQIWNADLDLPDPGPRSVDIPCNVASHLMIRAGRLEWLQIMRSNDLVWGMPVNVVQFTCLQEMMAGWLGVEVGNYIHISDSLHVYAHHWDHLDSLSLSGVIPRPVNNADLRIQNYEEWESVWRQLVEAALSLTEHTDADAIFQILENHSDMPLGYVELLAVLTAEALRLRGHADRALATSSLAGDFWGTPWRSWCESKRLT